jgi:hypothetical protein
MTELVFEYGQQNIVVLKAFIKDPFYTKIGCDEAMCLFHHPHLRDNVPKRYFPIKNSVIDKTV